MQELRAALRSRFSPYGDGRAAERVVRRVLLGEAAEPVAGRTLPEPDPSGDAVSVAGPPSP
ncbi:hypothetical protein [Streptomyces sp. NPDC057545]|uniref:hypothetical protein n=1 Tax=Streptomyces sp. NPDC057545 TaxID=3346164 RepID=UPI003688B9C6